ncbi:MAG TPA: tetratricopeptide repeat protein [Ignavibacteria bacterium]|nr:tetratricopeptide repeat protein [Ignavibacteria bacterium]
MIKLITFLVILLSFELLSQKNDAVKLVNSGVEAERTSNYTEALFYYSMAIDMDSKFADAYEKRADLYRRLKNYGKARQDYSWALNFNPASSHLWVNLGVMNYELTSYKDAIDNFTKVMDMNGEDADLLYFRGNAYNKNNEFQPAANDYAKALYLRPDFTEAREKLTKLETSYNIVGVIENKEQITEKTTDDNYKTEIKSGEKIHGKTEEKSGEKNVVFKEEQQLVSNEPKESSESAQEHILRGLAYYESKDFVKALDEYKRASEISPGFAEAYYHKGRAYTELNDFTAAIAEYTKTIELNPGHEKAFINRGFIYNEMKEYSKAISDFERGVEINPNSIIGYYNMGIAYHGLGNKNKTVECFQNAARLGDIDSQDWLKFNGYSY